MEAAQPKKSPRRKREDRNALHQPPQSAGPYRTQGRVRPVIHKPEEIFLYAPDINARHLPVCSLGRLRDGTKCLQFRQYKRNDDRYLPTRFGACFTLAEFREIIVKVAELVSATPELRDQPDLRSRA